MRNFRKIAVRVLAVFLTVCLFEGAVRYGFESWRDYSRITKLERAELKGTIDTVYAGTSLVYRSVNPNILDEILGTNSFNLATSAQPLMGSYYLIRETAEENPVKTVYVGITMMSLKQKDLDIRHVMAVDNLRTWKWKLAYLLALHRESVFTTSLLYSTRVQTYTQISKIKNNVKNKLTQTETARYGLRGYQPRKGVYKGKTKRKKNADSSYWDGEKKDAQALSIHMEYLEKIAEFCRDKGIRLVLFVPPLTQNFIDRAGDLDDWDRFCREFAGKWDADYYNFLLYKERQSVFTNETFHNAKHINTTGAKLFSELLAEVSASENPQEYFYTSMSEFADAHP